jgi:hypothetical protein
MMPAQNSLSRRCCSTAAVGGAAHGGYGADVGDGEVLSVGQPGGLAGGDVTGGGGRIHSPPFDHDVKGGIQQGEVAGATPSSSRGWGGR